MRVPTVLMVVRLIVMIVRFDADKIDQMRLHPAFSTDAIRKRKYRLGPALEHDAFEAVFMVQMHQRS